MQMSTKRKKEKRMRKTVKFITMGAVLFALNGCDGKTSGENVPEAKNGGGIVVTEGAVKALKKEGPSKENSGQFYYSYNKEKNGVDGYNAETTKVRTELDAYRAIRSPYERVQITLMIQQLSPDYRLLCSACHDDYANGVVGPALLDKNATYIFDQIIAFKTGKKQNVLMEQLVNRIEEHRLKAIAEEIERFNRQILEMRSKK
jgi:cytochrome c553